jgi:DNA polymerase-3 subunit alpha
MYFSGHMLDSYGNHVRALGVDQISRLLEQDESGAFTVNERERVSVAGVINRVTMKTTRKEERMAFFTMEDRYGEIECLVFPKGYASYGHAIHPDAAVCVRGTISCRENEDPKILVDNLLLLVDNETYVHVPEQQESSVAKPTATKPVEAKPTVKQPPRPRESVQGRSGKLYLRLPDSECYLYRKALNLVEIFPGSVPVVFYDGQSKTYRAWRGGIALSDYLMSEFVRLLGEENVIFK